MNRGLAADLARWERGEVRAEQLMELHPETRVDALVEMHAFLSYLVSEPEAEPGPSWESLAARLPDREPVKAEVITLAPRSLPVRRVIAAFVTGAVLVPAAAAAAKADAVRELNDRVGRAVTELLTDSDAAGNEDAMGANVVTFVPAASGLSADESAAPVTNEGPAALDAPAVAPVESSAPGTESSDASRPVSPSPASATPTSPAPSESTPPPAPEVSPTPVADEPVADEPVADEPVAAAPAASEPTADRTSNGQGTPSTNQGRSEGAPGQAKKADASASSSASSSDHGRSADAGHSGKGRPAEVPGRGDDHRRA